MSQNKFKNEYWSPRTPLVGRFEDEFDIDSNVNLLKTYWWVTIFLSLIYLGLVYYGVEFMKNRPAFNLRKPLAIWSACLAVFSFFGALHCIPEAFYASQQGIHYFFCNKTSLSNNRVLQFWIYWFSLSKFIEFGDTLFIVLRKQKLSFLHYIHHALTLIFAVYTYGENGSLMRMGTMMNYTVHAIMYSYYALKALRFRVPRNISIVITVLQISQMIVGFYGMLYCFRQTLTGVKCDTTIVNAAFGLFIYGLFLILFVNFFVRTYLLCSPTPVKDSKDAKDDTKKKL